jgi:hypothetical protein
MYQKPENLSQENDKKNSFGTLITYVVITHISKVSPCFKSVKT